jgi:hypothetical protein
MVNLAVTRADDIVGTRNVDAVERVGKFAWWRPGLGEVPVEDGGDVGAIESPIFLGLGSRPPTVKFVVWIRLAVTRQDAVGILLMETKGVCEQSGLRSERSGLGRHAHRRTEDSILSIMTGMMPFQTSPGQVARRVKHLRVGG